MSLMATITGERRTPFRNGKNLGQVFEEELAPFGLKLSDDEREFILWEKTGWPCFWSPKKGERTPEDCLRRQLREAFVELAPKVKLGRGGRRKRQGGRRATR